MQKKNSKDNVKQVHGCQETEKYQNRTTHKNGQKITQTAPLGRVTGVQRTLCT